MRKVVARKPFYVSPATEKDGKFALFEYETSLENITNKAIGPIISAFRNRQTESILINRDIENGDDYKIDLHTIVSKVVPQFSYIRQSAIRVESNAVYAFPIDQIHLFNPATLDGFDLHLKYQHLQPRKDDDESIVKTTDKHPNSSKKNKSTGEIDLSFRQPQENIDPNQCWQLNQIYHFESNFASSWVHCLLDEAKNGRISYNGEMQFTVFVDFSRFCLEDLEGLHIPSIDDKQLYSSAISEGPISYRYLWTKSPADQIREIITNAKIIDLKTLTFLFPLASTFEDVLELSQKSSTMVLGLLTPKPSDTAHSMFEMFCRELILTLFVSNTNPGQGIDINQFQTATQCPRHIAERILKEIGSLQGTSYQMRKPADTDFVDKFNRIATTANNERKQTIQALIQRLNLLKGESNEVKKYILEQVVDGKKTYILDKIRLERYIVGEFKLHMNRLDCNDIFEAALRLYQPEISMLPLSSVDQIKTLIQTTVEQILDRLAVKVNNGYHSLSVSDIYVGLWRTIAINSMISGVIFPKDKSKFAALLEAIVYEKTGSKFSIPFNIQEKIYREIYSDLTQ